MNLIKVISENYNLLFFIILFFSIFIFYRIKIYNLITITISFYVSALLISFFFLYTSISLESSDRRTFVKNGMAEFLIVVPQLFLEKQIKFPLDSDHIKFPIGSIPNVRTILCEEDEGPIIFQSDRYGFMNQEQVWDSKIKNILIIGDSHAQGNCVNETIQKNLNTKHQLNTISLGQGGNGPLIALASAKEFTEYNNVNYIYYIMSTNDYSRENFSDLPIDFELEVKNEYLLDLLNSDKVQDYFKKNSLKNATLKLKKLSNELTYSYQNNNLLFNKILEFISLKYFLINTYFLVNPIINDGIRFLSSENEILLSKTLKSISKLNNGRVIFITRANKNCVSKDQIEYTYLNNILSKNGISKKKYY